MRGDGVLRDGPPASCVGRGSAAAQLLGYADDVGGRRTIRYVTLSSRGGEMLLVRRHVIEAEDRLDGSADLLEMTDVARWEPTLEQFEQGVDDPAESFHPSVAIARDAARFVGAVDARWTNESMVDLEYDDLRRGRWPHA